MSPIALSVPLPARAPCVLAVGAFLKNTICVAKDGVAHLSVNHGDLGTPEAITAFETSVESMLRELDARPVMVAHDLHPDFHSTRFAQGLDLPVVAVQHHHAHAAAIAAEHGHAGPVLGLLLDGFGLGPNNESWGGELLWCDGPIYRRLGHLRPLAQPGGDIAAREPWRMAAAALHALGQGDTIAARWPDFPAAARLAHILERGLNSPATSSMGRLFDAACGLLGVHPKAEFEGQAPMALEALVRHPRVLAGGWTLGGDGVLDFRPLLAALARGMDVADGADLFHGTLIDGLTAWCVAAAERHATPTIALGGGCFLNAVLRHGLVDRLKGIGLTVLAAIRTSPGDAGLALGQAWIASQTEISSCV